jgi:hypothetical protein
MLVGDGSLKREPPKNVVLGPAGFFGQREHARGDPRRL